MNKTLTQRTSLQSTDLDELPKINSGIKLDNKRSRFANKVGGEEFEKKATEHFENDEEIKKKAFQLSSQFVSFIKDKTLPENKGPIQKDLESDVARQIVDISLALNNDQTKPEGIGSAGCIMLLLRSVLIQRDIINELSYKVSIMEKQASSKAKDGNVK